MVRIRLWWLALMAGVLVATGGPVGAVDAAPAATPTEILVGIIADAPPVRAGQTTTALGVIRASGGATVAGVSVQLLMRPYGAASYTTVGTAVSGSTGDLTLATPALTHNARFFWHFPGGGGYDPASSIVWSVPVSPRVGIRVSDRTPGVGRRVVVRGRTYPAKPGNVVSLWRGTKPVQGYGPATHHVRLAKGRVRADGRYRLVVRFPTAGDRRIYVKVGRGGGNVAGYSAYRWLRVG